MITAGQFRNGVTIEHDGQVLQVVEFQHVKPGKGAAFVRTKTKNVITGSVVETSYNPTAKFPQAFIERREVTYSYEDGGLYHFLDVETYDDIPVSASDVPDNFKFCKENETCKLLSYKGKVFSVEIPNFVELEVTATEPGVKGNTATNTLRSSSMTIFFPCASPLLCPVFLSREVLTMDLNAKAAYIRGLMTGMEFDPASKNGKVIAAMMDLLEEMAATVTEHDDALDQVYDELEILDEDMDDLVSDLYDVDFDEDEPEEEGIYEETCPNCGEVATVDEETLLNKELVCPNCGAAFDIELEADEEPEGK